MTTPRTCTICGKEFKTNYPHKKTCGAPECVAKQKYAQERQWNQENPRCVICRKPLTSSKQKLTCSPECHKQHKVRYNRMARNSPAVTGTCVICGKQFQTHNPKQRKTCGASECVKRNSNQCNRDKRAGNIRPTVTYIPTEHIRDIPGTWNEAQPVKHDSRPPEQIAAKTTKTPAGRIKCIRTNSVYLEGHYYNASYIRQDIKHGYVSEKDFQL